MVSEVILIKAERLILTLQHKSNGDSESILSLNQFVRLMTTTILWSNHLRTSNPRLTQQLIIDLK